MTESQTETEVGSRVEMVLQAQPVFTQTDETMASRDQEVASARALKMKCQELERMLEEREKQGL